MDIRDKARGWAKQVVELHGLDVPPHLEKRKRSLLKKADVIRQTLEATDSLAPLRPMADELGFIPLLIAGGVAAMTAMTKWGKEAYTVKKDSEKYDALVKSGLSPEQAQKIMTGSTFPWKWVVLGTGVTVGAIVLFKVLRSR